MFTTPEAAMAREEDAPALTGPTEGQKLIANYRSTGLTLGRHPLALLREKLLAMRLMPAEALMGCRNGQLARGGGTINVRQRTGTAKARPSGLTTA
ncbi:hypothetical protein [Paraburkholderia aromaticivorans]|uniref:hypothetical protein n=1 Tax=Paraburkholderia aromaticivorans TaxID=2026199 RepID=UPI001ABFD0D2|nr:hypothetical protein [Paraburkholderia aromaticivorans]